MSLLLRRVMSIISAYNEAWEKGDVDALAEIIHDDFVFNPHVGGITMGKSDLLGFAGAEGAPRSENDRILFENDSVGVAHSIVHFSNDSASEAVLSFMKFKDGKIISMETGATPLSDDYKLVGQE
jgi:ketosteroid isomerase-like protein